MSLARLQFKIDIQKPIVFLYTNNKESQIEKISTICNTILKKVKHLGLILTKDCARPVLKMIKHC